MADTPPPVQLGQMITGAWISQAIYAAAKFGIADLLSDGAKSVDELASASGTKPDLLYRLLRALASVGIFTEEDGSRFSLTPLAEFLRSDVEGSQRATALMLGDEHFFLPWSKIADAIQTGDNAFEQTFGKPGFERIAELPELARIVDDAMMSMNSHETAAMLDSYDFSGINVIADIGGGNGAQITAILQKHPNMQGILFDLPHVVERAQPNIEAAGLSGRCQLVGGDFFQSVPDQADAYLMRHIIHDWNDERSMAILKNCHAVMAKGDKLLLVESVIPPGNDPFMAKFLDLAMMLFPGGKERTEDEYRELFDRAGFELARIVPTCTEVSVIEGIRR